LGSYGHSSETRGSPSKWLYLTKKCICSQLLNWSYLESVEILPNGSLWQIAVLWPIASMYCYNGKVAYSNWSCLIRCCIGFIWALFRNKGFAFQMALFNKKMHFLTIAELQLSGKCWHTPKWFTLTNCSIMAYCKHVQL
jgi:hypothetical protein